MESSSDESIEEEVPVDVLGSSEIPGVACRLKPVFDDIFADVQVNIPALELDNSFRDSSDDEEPVLFSREEWLLQNSLSEALAPESKPLASPTESATDSGISLSIQDRPTTSSSSLSDCDQDNAGFLYSSSIVVDATESHVEFTSDPTDSGPKNSDIHPTEKHANDCIPQNSTMLNKKIEIPSVDFNDQEDIELKFDLIEQLNLSHFLERANEVTVASVFPPWLSDSDISDKNAGGIEDRCNSLMEELVRLSQKQQDAAAPIPKPPCKAPDQEQHQDIGIVSCPSVASVGVTACLGPAKHQKCSSDTVFLDLRNEKGTAPNQIRQNVPSSISRILGRHQEEQDMSSSSDEEDVLQQWQAQRRKAKEASLLCTSLNASKSSQWSTTSGSGVEKQASKKTQIEVEKVETIPASSQGEPVGFFTLNDDVVEEKGSKKAHVVREAWVDPRPTQCQVLSEKKRNSTKETREQIDPGKAEKEHVLPSEPTDKDTREESTRKKDKTSSDIIGKANGLIEASKVKVKETASSKQQRLKTEAEEKAKRQRLHKSLQNLKPQFSSLGRQPPALYTPVLFGEEVSYDCKVSGIPQLETSDGSKNYLLLSSKLSSCGELAAIGRQQGPKAISTPDMHCLSSLIAWLTCLIPLPGDTKFINYAELSSAPFYVIGLQQCWHDGELWLEVGICNREEHSAQENRTKRKNKGNNTFKQSVAKYLSTNTLFGVFSRIAVFTYSPNTGFPDMPISKRNLSTLLTVNPDPGAMQRVFEPVTGPGFFWQSMDIADSAAPYDDRTTASNVSFPGREIQTTVMLMTYDGYHRPFCMLDVLVRVYKRSLDLAGLRLLYQRQESKMVEEKPAVELQSFGKGTIGQSHIPLLALAIRGPQAIAQWQDEVGPVDARLALRTDPNSLRAGYSNGAKEDHIFWCARNFHAAELELVRWFGGRVPASGVINVGRDDPVTKGSAKGKTEKNSNLLTSSLHSPSPRPPCFLTANTDTFVFFFISPLVPIRFIGHIICTCYQRGFCTQAIKRIHLNSSRLTGLGLSQDQMTVFCAKHASRSDSNGETRPLPPVASTILLLRRENAVHHVLSLIETLATDFTPNASNVLLSQCSFLSVPYSDTMLKQLGGDFSLTPNPATYPVDILRRAFHSNPELEQVCVLTLLKQNATVNCGIILNTLLVGEVSQKKGNERTSEISGFELLGLKLVPSLSMYQAKELTPCEIGDKLWQTSLQTLTSGPALIVALRGTHAFVRLSHFIDSYLNTTKSKNKSKEDRTNSNNNNSRRNRSSMDMFLSCTPELAYRQLSVIFFDKELFSDGAARRNLLLIPPPRRVISGSLSGSSEALSGADPGSPPGGRKQKGARAMLDSKPWYKGALNSVETLRHGEMSVFQSLLEKARPIPTVCILKPGNATKHLGKVLKRIAQEGFYVINMRMMVLTPSLVSEIMGNKEGEADNHVSYMTSGPVVALCLQRENAVGHLLDLLGPSNPAEAKKQSQFYLRGSYGQDSVHNALYASETYSEAIRDVKLLFPEGVCCPSTVDLKAEGISCLALDDLVSFSSNRSLVELSEEEQTAFDNKSPAEMTLLPSSLLEINCLLLLPELSPCRTAVPGKRTNSSICAEVLDALVAAGFHVIGLRMVLLGVTEAADCAKLLSGSLPADWKPHHLASKLSQPSCVVIAVLRDNAVTCFDSLCESSPKLFIDSSEKYVVSGQTLREAKKMVECFFDQVMPNRKAKIVQSVP